MMQGDNKGLLQVVRKHDRAKVHTGKKGREQGQDIRKQEFCGSWSTKMFDLQESDKINS